MDVLESFISIRASPEQVRPFFIEEPWIEAWIAPSAELVGVAAEGGALAAGATFDVVLGLPTSPAVHCQVERTEAQGGEIRYDGLGRGLIRWQLLPAGRDTVVRVRYECELSDRRWLVPWALAGRWLTVLYLGYLLRRLKARVEDTVGSSRFGVPLLVSRYAVATSAMATILLLGLLAERVLRWLASRHQRRAR